MKIKYYFQIALALIVLASFCIAPSGNYEHHKRKSNRKAVNTATITDTEDTTTITSIHNTLKIKNTKTSPTITQIIYKSSNTHEGIIGLFNKDRYDNPAYNVFHISVDKNITDNTEVWLEYELYGLQDFTSVCRSINDQLSTGGYFVRKSEGWSKQSEKINPNILRLGLNVVRFTVPENAPYGYKVRNVCLRVKPITTDNERKLTVNQPNNFTYFRKFGYLQGFVSGTGSEKAKLTINGKRMSTNNGTFEGLVEKQDTGKGAWNATVIAEFEDGMQLKTNVEFNKQSDYDYTNTFYNPIQHSEQQISPTEKINVLHKGLQLSGDTNSLLTTANLSVTTLRAVDMPSMGTGMVNVTGEGKGYRLLPHQKFEKNLLIKIKYDTTLLPVGYRPQDIRTYYFDETANNWKVLPLDTIDKINCMVVSRTNHFTDFINSIIKVPELPETQAYTPTSLKDVKVANPLQGINLIQPPSANNMGTANLSFPIEIPAGRQGMQPNLTVQYNSSGGNGWMGMGWDVSIPSINVETRWGVPRYSSTLETESYLLAGEELLPQIQRQAYGGRSTTQVKQFYPRVEGAFNRIIRHGTTPQTYWWTVTDRNGVTSYYGVYPSDTTATPSVVLKDDAGNIAHWALTETMDLEGNSVRYNYTFDYNTGLSQGSVTGLQIYISSIIYTNYINPATLQYMDTPGQYIINFNLDDGSREDGIISCRYGFKEVTTHLLRSISVRYANDSIRKYVFKYKTGAFDKTLLCKICEYSRPEEEFPGSIEETLTSCTPDYIKEFFPGIRIHEFEYYDNSNETKFVSGASVTPYDDQTKGSTLFPFSPDGTIASSIGGTNNTGSGYGGALGIGLDKPYCKNLSIDANYNHSSVHTQGYVTLADIDGDGLPDKVIWDKSDNTVYYRRLLHDANGNYHFDSSAVKLNYMQPAMNNFFKSDAYTNSWGAELHIGLGDASFNLSGAKATTDNTSSIYFADVNADGKVDLVNNGVVYFNQTGPLGQYFAAATSNIVQVGDDSCNNIVYTGQILDNEILAQDTLLQESVRLWVAPFDGSINIDAPIQLIQDTSYYRKQSRLADGIRYTIQHDTTELIIGTLNANNYNVINNNYNWLTVNKGDRIYFRLQSKYNREYDNVLWDPRITYTNCMNADTAYVYQDSTVNFNTNFNTDIEYVNLGLIIDSICKNYVYQASNDFMLAGKGYLPMPMNGEVRIRGTITAPALSDTVSFQIYKNNTNLINEVTFPCNTPINYYLDNIVNVDSTDIFNFYIRSNTEVKWSSIKNDLKISYIQDDFPIDTNVWDTLSFKPLLQYNLYQNTIVHSGYSYNISGNANCTISPVISYKDGESVTGNLVFAIKRTGSLINKIILNIQSNVISGDSSLTIDLPLDSLSFEFYSDSIDYANKITNANVATTVNGNQILLQAGLYVPMNDTLYKFGNLYRGWGQFCYNPDSAHVFLPIDESKLTLGASFQDPSIISNITISDIDTSGNDKYTNLQNMINSLGLINPLHDWFGMMTPDLDSNVYRGFGDITMVGANKMSNAQKPVDSLNATFDSSIPQVPIYSNGEIVGYQTASAPWRQSRTISTSYNISAGFGVNFGFSHTSSSTEIKRDFMDMNGDGYPDIIGTDNIQYTTPQGGLENTLNYNNTTNNFSDHGTTDKSSSDGISVGVSSIQNLISLGKDKKGAQSPKFSTKIDGSLSGSGITGTNTTDYALIDINGDGLPDKVYSDDSVALNLGYKFAAKEKWNNILTGTEGSSCQAYNASGEENAAWGTLIGTENQQKVNKWQTSFALGIGVTTSTSDNVYQVIDVNGDGLPDIVQWNTSNTQRQMTVRFNTGNGFTEPYNNWYQDSYTENGSSHNEYGDIAATLGIVLFSILDYNLSILINPKIDIDYSFSKEKVQLRDMDDDGYPDYVTSNLENDISVKYSTIGKTNLLKEVNTPVGNSFDMDYTLSDNSVKSPHRYWQLASLKVFDGHIGDGVDTTLTTFSYKDPYYERYERQSYGYDTVITSTWNTGATTPYIYRTLTDAYHNDNYMFKGLKKYELLSDSASNKFVETVYTWMAALIATGQIIPDNQLGCFEGYYPVVTQEDRYYYEGAPEWSIHTEKQYIYGRWGNVTQYTDLGDMNDPNDDLIANISYDTIIPLNLLSLQSSIVVTHDGSTPLRSRSATYNQNTGKPNSISIANSYTNFSITNFTYDKYGNVDTVTYPENMYGQRKQYYYVYDSITHTYPISVSDEQGYTSTATYDLRFGKPLLTTDISGNNMLYTYDNTGRTKTITGPKEIAAGKPYTIKFDYWDDYYIDPNDGLIFGGGSDTVLWARTHHYDQSWDSKSEITTILFTDGLGRVIQTKKNTVINDQNGNYYDMMVVSGQNILDAYGRVVSTTYPITEAMGQDSIFNYNVDTITPTYITYDVMDRKTSVTMPDQATTTMNYGFGADNFSVLRFQTITTNANNIQTATYTTPRELETTIVTDYANTNDTTNTNTITSFVYDAVGELLISTDPEGNSTYNTYDNQGKRTQRVHPDAGTTNWTYDNAGNLSSMQTQNLIDQTQQINYIYDYNHLIAINYPQNPENNVYYQYDPHPGVNSSNRIIRQQDASGVQQFFYGNLGELTKNIHTFVMPGGSTYTFAMEWNYDTWNRLQNIIYPDGEKVNYNYDHGGQLQSMYGSKSGTTYNYINGLGYDKFGSRNFMYYGNGSITLYTYNDSNRRLINLTSSNSSGTLQNISYNYDNIGNITGVSNGANAASNNLGGAYQYNYTYDNINRLKQSSGIFWDYEDLPCADYTLQMQYSASGNILYKDQSVSANINGSYVDKSFNNAAYQYNTSKPHAVSTINTGNAAYGDLYYDDNGNMTDFDNYNTSIYRSHCWDEENRLSAVSDENYLSDYIYDAGGERVWKLTGQVQQMLDNNEEYINIVNLNSNTLYTSPYMVVNDQGYSKHYYIEGQRICSKLGGGLQNSLVSISDTTTVTPLFSNYTNIASGLKNMLYRNIGCVSFNPDNMSIDSSLEVLDTLINVDNVETDQYFYHTDHLGSSSFITDINSTPTEHLQYLPFGDIFVQQRATSDYYTIYKFTGKEQDDETGYYYMIHRYYDPNFGFNTPDKMMDKYPNISPYAYCMWNPIRLIDPDGKKVLPMSFDALYIISLGLSPEEVQYINLDENGFIDVSLLRKGMNELETVGENYSSLLKLAEDDKIIEVYTQNYTESSQGNNSMGPVYYDSELDSWYSFSDKKVSKEEYATAHPEYSKEAVWSGTTGRTLYPDEDCGYGTTLDGNIQIYINTNILNADKKEGYKKMVSSFAHEGYGHTLFKILGLLHSHGTIKSTTSDSPNNNKMLEIQIKNRENEANKNYDLQCK